MPVSILWNPRETEDSKLQVLGDDGAWYDVSPFVRSVRVWRAVIHWARTNHPHPRTYRIVSAT